VAQNLSEGQIDNQRDQQHKCDQHGDETVLVLPLAHDFNVGS
jgi:hypothetical protein